MPAAPNGGGCMVPFTVHPLVRTVPGMVPGSGSVNMPVL